MYSTCCQQGAANIPTDYNTSYPAIFRDLMLGTDKVSAEFQRHIRSYNNALSFTSLGAKVDKSTQGQQGIFTFRISGNLFHNIRPVHPATIPGAGFSQIYVIGSNDEAEAEMRVNKSGVDLNQGLMFHLQAELNRINPFAKWYRTHQQILRHNPAPKLVLKTIDSAKFNAKTYNKPTVEEIAMVIHDGQDDRIDPRDIVLHDKAGEIRHMTDEHSAYLPLRYPVLFLAGQGGWVKGLPPTSSRRRQKITQLEWYTSMLFSKRGRLNHLQWARTLFQEFVVDIYICVERGRLDYFCKNQGKIKSQIYKGVREAVRNAADPKGLKVILPSSFIGSPRHMIQMYQDSMAIADHYGKPSLFVTMTADPHWDDVAKALPPGVSASDRPDIVTRVFELKQEELIEDLTQFHVLGRCLAHVGVVEFQKRGLPHCHIMLFLHPNDIPRTAFAVDSIVCAEIPDPTSEPKLHKLVGQHMIHGPCTKAQCLVDGECAKHFPKPFQDQTEFVEDSYPLYQRRDTGTSIDKAGHTFNNQHVVPYNKFLLAKYKSHINVEIPYGVLATKYLFKYICKGVDRSALELKSGDETLKFVHGRYVGPCEAVHRLLHFPISWRYPAVRRLALHLPDEQTIYYKDAQGAIDKMQSGMAELTTLTQFFALNRDDEVGYLKRARDLLYHEILLHFYWYKNREWRPQKKPSDTIGRLYFASPTDGNRYYLRVLLQNIRGPFDFDDLKTVGGTVMNTFREAAGAKGYLVSDAHYEACLSEASSWMVGGALRSMFCMLLIHSPPTNPGRLLDQFIDQLSDDCKYKLRHWFPSLSESRENARSLGRFMIFCLLEDDNKTWSGVGLPDVDQSMWTMFRSRQGRLNKTGQVLVNRNPGTMTRDQRSIYDQLVNAIANEDSTPVFVDGPAGCGKTFLLNMVIDYCNRQNWDCLVMASSGVASLMLDGGGTAHSKLSIPLTVNSQTMCKWDPDSILGAQLLRVKVIIWDEITMTNRNVIEMVDRSLRDLRDCDLLFGGVLVVFGGDFRQTLPVVRRGDIFAQGAASLIGSRIWHDIRSFRLTENLRI
ncbi:hypothetical protein MJO29_005326 [Puccinia striiformis f. sp. tritici]|nr:hypothetical protein MJO29_005326 [Puccinia striiformis f. sp. tritici]